MGPLDVIFGFFLAIRKPKPSWTIFGQHRTSLWCLESCRRLGVLLLWTLLKQDVASMPKLTQCHLLKIELSTVRLPTARSLWWDQGISQRWYERVLAVAKLLTFLLTWSSLRGQQDECVWEWKLGWWGPICKEVQETLKIDSNSETQTEVDIKLSTNHFPSNILRIHCKSGELPYKSDLHWWKCIAAKILQSYHVRQKSGERIGMCSSEGRWNGEIVKWYTVFVDKLMMELQVSWKVASHSNVSEILGSGWRWFYSVRSAKGP